jgi:hypothetical protein
VAGLGAEPEAAELRTRGGLAGQYAAVDENLTEAEDLVMVGQLYHLSKGEPQICWSALTSAMQRIAWFATIPEGCVGASTQPPPWLRPACAVFGRADHWGRSRQSNRPLGKQSRPGWPKEPRCY